MAVKGDLTAEEVLKVGYLHLIKEVEQHDLSIAFSVNSGRISEAAQVMDYASKNYRNIYREITKEKANARDGQTS